MQNIGSRTGIGVAVAAIALAIVLGVFVPYAYPWPSVAFALVACAAVVWAAKSSREPTQTMNDVINGVEAEPRAAATAGHGEASKRAVP